MEIEWIQQIIDPIIIDFILKGFWKSLYIRLTEHFIVINY